MASLTVGYSDSEDRVWVRLVGEYAEQRVWLTRRTVWALINALSDRLEASLAELDSIVQIEAAQRLVMEQTEAAGFMNAESAGPRTSSEKYQVLDNGLCTVFDLEGHDERWVVRLHSANAHPLVFNGNRLQMHQLLKSLLNRQREAEWRLSTASWLGATS